MTTNCLEIYVNWTYFVQKLSPGTIVWTIHLLFCINPQSNFMSCGGLIDKKVMSNTSTLTQYFKFYFILFFFMLYNIFFILFLCCTTFFLCCIYVVQHFFFQIFIRHNIWMPLLTPLPLPPAPLLPPSSLPRMMPPLPTTAVSVAWTT